METYYIRNCDVHSILNLLKYNLKKGPRPKSQLSMLPLPYFLIHFYLFHRSLDSLVEWGFQIKSCDKLNLLQLELEQSHFERCSLSQPYFPWLGEVLHILPCKLKR